MKSVNLRNDPDPEVIRAMLARVQSEAARLMVAHDELSVNMCLTMAWQVELVLYGNPFEPPPVGILGRSPIQAFKEGMLE
jgi:hypothetical protein